MFSNRSLLFALRLFSSLCVSAGTKHGLVLAEKETTCAEPIEKLAVMTHEEPDASVPFERVD